MVDRLWKIAQLFVTLRDLEVGRRELRRIRELSEELLQEVKGRTD